VSSAIGGTTFDVTYYQNHATNFLDHEQLGESSVFLPVNIAEARLRGLELSATSRPDQPVRVRFVYALGYAQASGAIAGGLGDIEPSVSAGAYFLDHDQRHTAVLCVEYRPTSQSYAHVALHYGSGFLRQDGPDHLSSHVTADVGTGLRIRSRWSAAVEVENLMNQLYFVNLSSEFNGTHVARPRSATARVRVTF
jgi:outer membrane receptor protein involved in Fe transport